MALTTVGACVSAACAERGGPAATTRTANPARPRPAPGSPYAVADPGALSGPLLSADILVVGERALSTETLHRLRQVHGVDGVIPFGMSASSFSGRTLNVAAIDPATFRRLTPLNSARDDAVWRRVAQGEAVVDPTVGRKEEQPSGYLTLGQGSSAQAVHIGAYAPLVRSVQAAVDQPRAKQLGIPSDNAALVSTGSFTPSALMRQIEKIVAGLGSVQELALEFDIRAVQTAVLSGASVPQTVGSFTYTRHPDGTISPNPRWVSEYIRTEEMPIIGHVTGNKAMFPQLQAALEEIVGEGIAGLIHPDEYGGCYVPRFIAHDPALGLSLHSWGIAVDLNVPENLRGTRGHMDPRVIAAFKKWGFDWGGDWHYTDPMHFEMSSVVKVR